MNENYAALVSPSGNVSFRRLEFEARNRSQDPGSSLRSASGGWKRPDSAPSSRGSSRASSFSARRPEFQRQPLPSSWRRQSFSGQSEALSTVHESTSTHGQTEAVGIADGSAQTNAVPERKDSSTQANIAPDYASTPVQTSEASETTNSAQTAPIAESTSSSVQTLDTVPEITTISTQTEPDSPKPRAVATPETTSASTKTPESFSPREFVTSLGLSSFDKIKRSISWPINKKSIEHDSDTDSDSVDDASTIVEEELPIRLFGNGEPVDPVLKAFQLQDSIDARLDKLSPTKKRDKGLALSKGTLRWLRDHEPGQRQWTSSESDPPCAVCHATREDAARSVMDGQLGFCSSLNLKYNDSEQYAWSFGSRYIVREKQYWNLKPSQLPAEVWASRLLKKHTKAPTPAVVAAWKEGHVAITIVERAKGQPLAEVWSSLPEARRASVAKQVAGHVQDWRRMKTNKIAALDGERLFRDDVGKGTGAEKISIKDDEQYRAFVREKIVAKGWQQMLAEMAVELIPACQPFVFTHGNLTMDNIFVREGRVVAITGLGRAAYLPVWAESLELHQAYGEAEREWKEMLFKYIGTEGVKPYYNVYEELIQVDEAAIQEKTATMQNKLADMLGTKRAKEEKLEQAQEAAEARTAAEEDKARKLKEKYPKMNALQIQRAEEAEKDRLRQEKRSKARREAAQAKKREEREAEKAKRREEREAGKAKKREEREAEKAKRREEREQTRKAEGKEVTEQDEEEESSGEKGESSDKEEESLEEEAEESPDEEVKIPTPTEEKPRRRGFGESRKFQATNKPMPLFLGKGSTAGPRRGLFDNNITVDPKATMDSSSTKEGKPALKLYAEGFRPNKFAVFHGVPFSPGTIAKRKRSSVFLAVARTRARQMYPNGFHILETKQGEEIFSGDPKRQALLKEMVPYLRPVFDSVLTQIPDSKIKLTDLALPWLDAMEDMLDRADPNEFGVYQKMALTLRKWGESREDPLDLCLGAVYVDGRDWVDYNDAQVPWSENVVWIMILKNGSLLPEHYRGLCPIRRKLSTANGSEAT
ncbi:Actin-like protein 10 [Pestalotiopsis sp. 9143b]|nr:Actin-like protein 10 [Pestalotiopsis sp. 9143b]